MEPSDRNRHAESLFADLPRTYERMGAMLSFGQDPAWRRSLVRSVSARLAPNARILDVATGTGAVARELRGHRPDVKVVGLDQSEPMLHRAAATANGSGHEVVLARAEALPFAESTFDGLTFTYLLRYVDDPAATMAELARVVRPGGVVGCVEFHVPAQPWWVPWWVYTRAVMPVVGRVVSPAWNEVGRFLGPSISGFYADHPLAEQLAWWRAAGLKDVRWQVMSFGGGVVIWGVKGGR